MNEISLNSSMRSNLLSLQQTQILQDMTQLRLSTGLKVNSAIDNPSNYYTASSLSNRANDLSSLLDAMSQGIQTIKAASDTLTTATKYLEQAKAVAVKASEADLDIIAKVKTEDELFAAINSGKIGYIVIAGDINLFNTIELKNNQNLVGDNYFKEYNGPNRKLNFNFDNQIDMNAIFGGNHSIISNLDINYASNATQTQANVVVFLDKKDVKISNLNINVDIPNMDASLNSGIFFRSIYFRNSDVKITQSLNIQSNAEQGQGISSNGSVVDINAADIKIKNIGNRAHALAGNSSTFNINSGTTLNILTTGNTARGIHNSTNSIFNINQGANLNIQTFGASSSGVMTYNGSTTNIYGNINIKAAYYGIQNATQTSASAKGNTTNIMSTAQVFIETTNSASAIINGYAGNSSVTSILLIERGAKLGLKYNNNSSYKTATNQYKDINNTLNTNTVIKYSSAIAEMTIIPAWTLPDWDVLSNAHDNFGNQTFTGDYEPEETNEGKQYNSILEQYNQLINDAGYKGINLLLSQDLKINFNEERSSKIDVKGIDASTKGLGLTDAKWKNQTDIQDSLDEISSAINQIRSQSSEFGNYYSVVNSRIDFTDNLINVLTEGSDKLTLADMNEESANMLALQTRQQLAINALSLANQASQSVLRLF